MKNDENLVEKSMENGFHIFHLGKIDSESLFLEKMFLLCHVSETQLAVVPRNLFMFEKSVDPMALTSWN